MTPAEIISIILGVISIVLAIGISWYHIKRENKIKERNELFFVKQIQNNLKKMAQYFLDVEGETKYNEQYQVNNKAMMNALNTFYLRNEQEMKDLLYQTKLYLPFWSELPTDDKTMVNKILDVFSWLLYDYCPMSLPESMRELTVVNSRKIFSDKKGWMMTTTDEFLKKYPNPN